MQAAERVMSNGKLGIKSSDAIDRLIDQRWSKGNGPTCLGHCIHVHREPVIADTIKRINVLVVIVRKEGIDASLLSSCVKGLIEVEHGSKCGKMRHYLGRVLGLPRRPSTRGGLERQFPRDIKDSRSEREKRFD